MRWRFMAVLAVMAGCAGPVPPTVPVLVGPQFGQPGETLRFRLQSWDRNRDNLSYLVDWADGSALSWTAEAVAGETMSVWHVFASVGQYGVRARCRDETGRESEWSAALSVEVQFAGPVTPNQPSGPAAVHPDTVLAYSVLVGHVRNESVMVQFDWGDTLGAWSRMKEPGATVADTHRFRRLGTYSVRCRAKDRQGNTSPWSEALPVSVEPWPLEPPKGLRLSTVDGITVKLRWSAGRVGDSATYVVWFRDVADSQFAVVDSVKRTSYLHDPAGRTGEYIVSARRGNEERFAADTLSTIPVFSDTVVLYELNAPGLSGYGWDSVTLIGGPRTMLDTSQARSVACYFTDFAQGQSGPYYYIASPHLGPSDPGGLVRPGPWPRTGLYPLWGNIQNPLPRYDSLLYQPVVDINSLRTDMAVYIPRGNYALLSTLSPDSGTGTVRILSWIQAVPGLRLIAHRE